VRFTDEVSKSYELGVFNRGGHSLIDLHPGKTLDNPYSGNVIDICPVGALTEREFRFQCRVWYLETEDSICNGCARGCNISLHYNLSRSYKANGKRILRVKPRYNPDVNQWWICDNGRFGYEFINENRIETPFLNTGNGLQMSDWDDALNEVARAINDALDSSGPESVGVIVSPQLSNEDLQLSRELFLEKLNLSNVAFRNPWEEPGEEDDFLLRADRNPNSRSAEDTGFTGDVRSLFERASKGLIKVLYVFWHDFDPEHFRNLECLVFQGVNWNRTAESAQIVLPGATHAEKDGNFTNFEGRIQPFKQALLPIGEALPDTEILTRLAEKLGHPLSTSLKEAAV